MDDIGVKGPKTDYGGEEILPGVRRFMAEHIVNIDHVLADVERANAVVSGLKSQWCQPALRLVGFVCDSNGRHPQAAKIRAIVEWPACRNVRDVRAFLGVCVYYRN